MSDMKPLAELTKLLADLKEAAEGGESSGSKKPPLKSQKIAAPSRGVARVARGVSQFAKERSKSMLDFGRKVLALRKKHEKTRASRVAGNAAAVLGTMSGNLRTISGRYKGFGAALKATKLAEAGMRTFASANDAYSRMLGLPKPFGLVAAPAAAAAVAASGVKTMARISAQKFEEGGPARDKVMAELEGGEYVVARSLVSEMGGFESVEGALEDGGSEHEVAPVLNIRVAGRADASAIAQVREQVRLGLSGISG